MIYIKNIVAGYFGKKVLNNISFSINNGDFFGIIGENGTGKTTLLKVLCNLIKPYSGTIYIKNKNIDYFSKNELSKIISFLPQNMNTDFDFTVYDFIMFGRYTYMNILKIPSKNDCIELKKTIKILNINSLLQRKINMLSGGERQKVLIAQVLVQNTDIIILDEPTSHLDTVNQKYVFEILKKMNEKYNKTIIITLHDLVSIKKFCNKIISMPSCKILNS
jgi:iron complex transport system ATP-binding protein